MKKFRLILSFLILFGILISACSFSQADTNSNISSNTSDNSNDELSSEVTDVNDANENTTVLAENTSSDEAVNEAVDEPIDTPIYFELLLVFEPNTDCGYSGFEYDYSVTLEDESMTLFQIITSITLTGPYDPSTGEFIVNSPDLPGIETFEGVITIGETTTILGTYTYRDGNESTCDGLWPFSGEYIP